MPLFKNIPNLFTLLNLIFGCIACVMILQTGEAIVILDETNTQYVNLPERIWMGALFIFGAALIDFFDGFLARAMKAQSEMGKQLDSLSDVVSFGVAPGLILYQLLRIGYANEENGLNVSIAALLPAFVFTAAVAWRLARFNISTNQSASFRGVPSPAAGLVVASFPLLIFYQYFGIQQLFINNWFLYGVILFLSYLMLSDRRFIAIKFKNFSFRDNRLTYLLLVLAMAAVLILEWFAVPVIFVLYLLFSVFVKESPAAPDANKETLDVTV